MKKFNYVIKDELGIHARPAGMLVKMTKQYESAVEIRKGEKNVRASQLLMLMGLGVKQGEEVTVSIEGADEDQAYKELNAFFETNL